MDFKIFLSGLVSVSLFLLATFLIHDLPNSFGVAVLYFGGWTVAIFFGMAIATGFWQNYYESKQEKT